MFSDEKNALVSDLAINIGYGLGLMMGVYVAICVTGAHLNPAVTFAMALRGKTSWIKVWVKTHLACYNSMFSCHTVCREIFAIKIVSLVRRSGENYTCKNKIYAYARC